MSAPWWEALAGAGRYLRAKASGNICSEASAHEKLAEHCAGCPSLTRNRTKAVLRIFGARARYWTYGEQYKRVHGAACGCVVAVEALPSERWASVLITRDGASIPAVPALKLMVAAGPDARCPMRKFGDVPRAPGK